MNNDQQRIKLLIVDDSKLVRKTISGIFGEDDSIDVVGEAVNAEEALKLIPELEPDVITLDINMPGMDGLSALKHVMIKYRIPTLMLSSLTQEGSTPAFDSLKFGAVDFIPKTKVNSEADRKAFNARVIDKVKRASCMHIDAVRYQRLGKKEKNDGTYMQSLRCSRVAAVGASMGGYGSLLKIVPELPPDINAALLIMAYLPTAYVGAFVDYLDNNSSIVVKEAAEGMLLENSTCYIASAESYMTISEVKEGLKLHINPAPFGPEEESSINMLFYSVADLLTETALGVILGGVGKDGIEGVKEMIRVGARVIVQNPETCIEPQMPKSVIEKTQVQDILHDTQIAETIYKIVGEKRV